MSEKKEQTLPEQFGKIAVGIAELVRKMDENKKELVHKKNKLKEK